MTDPGFKLTFAGVMTVAEIWRQYEAGIPLDITAESLGLDVAGLQMLVVLAEATEAMDAIVASVADEAGEMSWREAS